VKLAREPLPTLREARNGLSESAPDPVRAMLSRMRNILRSIRQRVHALSRLINLSLQSMTEGFTTRRNPPRRRCTMGTWEKARRCALPQVGLRQSHLARWCSTTERGRSRRRRRRYADTISGRLVARGSWESSPTVLRILRNPRRRAPSRHLSPPHRGGKPVSAIIAPESSAASRCMTPAIWRRSGTGVDWPEVGGPLMTGTSGAGVEHTSAVRSRWPQAGAWSPVPRDRRERELCEASQERLRAWTDCRNLLFQDGVIPRSKIARCFKKSRSGSVRAGVANVFHAGEAIHPLCSSTARPGGSEGRGDVRRIPKSACARRIDHRRHVGADKRVHPRCSVRRTSTR